MGWFDVSAESWVEVLDDSDLPGGGGGIGWDAEDLGGAVVLVADAEGAFRLVVGIRVCFGFEIEGTARSGGGEDDPSVVYGVFPDFWVSVL